MKQLGDILIEQGLITETQLQKGLNISKSQNTRLGMALIDLGYLTEAELLSTLSNQFGIPMMPPGELVVDPTLLHFITPQLAKQYNIIPVTQKHDAILLATSDPMNTAIVGRIENQLKRRVIFNLATNQQVQSAIQRNYQGNDDMLSSMRSIEDYKVESMLDAIEPDDALLESGPIVKFVNQVLIGAVKERASDIHIERDGHDFHIRYRIDGILKTMFRPKLSLHPMIASRIKVMAKLDVSEHRIPQDGRIMFESEGYSVDLRVAVCPCIDGENIVSGPYDNSPVTIEDYVFPYKMLFTGSNALIRGTEMANDTSYGIKGAARYFSDTQSELDEDAINTKWNAYYGSKLGLKGGTDDVNGAYLDIELINAIDPFTAMYTLSSSLVSPLRESMFMGANAIANSFKKSASAYGTFNNEPEPSNSKILKYTLSCGPFVLTKWDKNQQIVFARNDDWFEYKDPVSGKLTGRYNIPGINYRVYDVSQNPEKTWDQFELSNLDSVGVPTKKVAEWRGKPGIYETEGDSTFKLNVNSCTQAQWDEFNTKEWHNQPGSWDVKPWMSNSNFLDGLFYSIDRKQFAEKRGVKPSINYFSDSYMSDPQNVLGQGGSYNATEAHKEAVKGYESFDENGNSDYGYDFDKALSSFRNAVKELSDQNKIALGTRDNPTEIHIHIRWMYQTDEKEYGEDIKYYFEKAFNDDAVCGGKVKLVVDQDAVTNWEDVYNVWMMKGKFDLGFGAISGNSFNPLNFMEVLKSDNSSSFTLNWGANTSKVDPLHPIVYDDGTGAKEWSYDGLWEVADHGGILNKGVKVDPVKSCRLGDTTRGGVGISDYYNGNFDLEIPISFVTFSSEVDNVEFDVNRVDAYCYGKGNVTLGEKSASTLTYDKDKKVIKIHVTPEVAKDVNDQIIAGQHFTKEQQEEEPAKYRDVFTDAFYSRYYDFEVYFGIIIGETETENFVTVSL